MRLWLQIFCIKPVDNEWIDVEKNIPILQLSNGVTSEHAAYKGEKIKQADVNLLAYPLKGNN